MASTTRPPYAAPPLRLERQRYCHAVATLVSSGDRGAFGCRKGRAKLEHLEAGAVRVQGSLRELHDALTSPRAP